MFINVFPLQRAASAASATASTDSGKAWSDEETQLLIKGVNMFPAGTANRWEVVASFIVQHASSELTPEFDMVKDL